MDVLLVSSRADEDSTLVETLCSLLHGLQLTCQEFVAHNWGEAQEAVMRHQLLVFVLTGAALRDPLVGVALGVAQSNSKEVILLCDSKSPFQLLVGVDRCTQFDRTRLSAGDRAEADMLRSKIAEACRWYGHAVGGSDSAVDQRYEFARAQAQYLGAIVLGYFNDIFYRNEVRDRRVKNFPTQADRTANGIIESAILRDSVTRHDRFVSEESSRDHESLRRVIEETEFVWIIDPLDGTLNFAYGFPYFCVSIGLLRNGRPVLGAIYNPTTQELYCGREGRQAECFDLRIGSRRTLYRHSGKAKLEDCVVMTHLSSDTAARATTLSLLDLIMEECRAVRMLGSGQMALVSLALGQFDVFFNYRTYIWDIVAGYVIVKGSGGYVTSAIRGGERWDWSSRGILAASNATVGEQFRALLENNLAGEFPPY